MKYVVYGLGTAAVLTLVAIVIYAAIWLYQQVLNDPSKSWVMIVGLGILCLSVIVSVVEYITDKRQTPDEA